jgi:hypothetical protein
LSNWKRAEDSSTRSGPTESRSGLAIWALLFALVGCTVGGVWFVRQEVLRAELTVVACWRVRDLVLDFAATNEGRLPSSWEELERVHTLRRDDFDVDISWFQQYVSLRFDRDMDSTEPFIQLVLGQASPEEINVNRSLWEGLNRIREQSPSS